MTQPLARVLLSTSAPGDSSPESPGPELTRRAVNDALHAQSLRGGALDTNLMELGLLTELRATQWLERAYGVSNGVDPLKDSPDRSLLGLFTIEQAARYRCIPFRLLDGLLDLLLADPSDQSALRELASTTGFRIRPSVATELRLSLLLAEHYSIHCDPRFVALAKVVGSAPTEQTGAAVAAPSDFAAPSPSRPGLSATESARSPGDLTSALMPVFDWELDPMAPTTPAHFDAGVVAGASSPPVVLETAAEAASMPTTAASTPTTAASTLEERLATSRNRQEAAGHVLAALDGHFFRVLLLAVQKDALLGWAGVGAGVVQAQIASLRLVRGPATAGISPFEQALSAGVYLGPSAAVPALDALFHGVGGPRPGSVLVSSILLGERPVALLHIEAHDQEQLLVHFEEVQRLGQLFGQALGRIVLASKAR